jgi:hypothetical protein
MVIVVQNLNNKAKPNHPKISSMRILIKTIFFLVITCSVSHAQFSFQCSAGANIPTFRGTQNFDSKIGYQLSMIGSYKFKPKVAFFGGLQYSAVNFNWPLYVVTFNPYSAIDYSEVFSLGYLEVPIGVKVNVFKGLYSLGGFKYGAKATASIDSKGPGGLSDEYEENGITVSNFSARIGVGYAIGKQWGTELIYDFGLTDFMIDKVWSTSDRKTYISTLQLCAFYKIGGKSR